MKEVSSVSGFPLRPFVVSWAPSLDKKEVNIFLLGEQTPVSLSNPEAKPFPHSFVTQTLIPESTSPSLNGLSFSRVLRGPKEEPTPPLCLPQYAGDRSQAEKACPYRLCPT